MNRRTVTALELKQTLCENHNGKCPYEYRDCKNCNKFKASGEAVEMKL